MFLEFTEVENPTGVTKRWEVINAKNGTVLGRVMWYGAWRKYTFHPAYPTTWDANCLQEVSEFLELRTSEHKQKSRP